MKTVIIQTQNGPVIINESDYNPEIHTLVGDEKPKAEEKEVIKPKRQYNRKSKS